MPHRTMSILCLIATALTSAACGGRASETGGNGEIVGALSSLPIAQRVAVSDYGYALPGGETQDDFFTEVRYAASPAVSTHDVVAAVSERLGRGWDVSHDGDAKGAVATFSRDDARVAVTAWPGGFDITVAADGARLDGTPLAL